MKEILEKLTQVTSPSGYEDAVRSAIEVELIGHVDSMKVDALGNLFAEKRGTGSGKRIMVSAHMDEIGFVATHIDDKGFIRFATVGGIGDHLLLGQRCRFINGTEGVFGCEKIDDIKDLKVPKMFIDIGATSKEEAASKVQVGDFAGYVGSFAVLGGKAVSKSLDDRAGCAILVEVARRLSTSPHDVYFIFSTQEEVGCRGAKTSAYAIEPHLGLAVDVTRTGDTPTSRTMDVSLGKGPAIKVKDSNLIAHPRVKGWMAETAASNGIPYQMEILDAGGTDAGSIHLTKGGVPSGTLSIPCRYIHTPAEMVDMEDLENCVRLMLALLQSELPV